MEDTQRSTPRITMLKKKGKRVLENADSIMSHLWSRFPAAEFETLEGKAIAVMSVKQQVSLSLLSIAVISASCLHLICIMQTACCHGLVAGIMSRIAA